MSQNKKTVSDLAAIARRYEDLCVRIGVEPTKYSAAVFAMAHQACPMRLDEWLHADESNFAHDAGGILRHFNMRTNKFEDCFLPRFAA